MARTSPKPTPTPTPSDIDRFWSKVDKSGACWLWTAARSQGYGRFVMQGSLRLAHRVSWYVANGRDARSGTILDHLCRNRACVNPAHLREVTNATNVRVGDRAKLTPAAVDAIRLVYAAGGISCREIASEFGVSTSTVGYVVNHRTWSAA